MAYRIAGLALASLTVGSAALGGGLERETPRLAPFFEPGRYLEFGVAYVSPNLSGDGGVLPAGFGGPATITGNTGDLLEDYFRFGAAYKAELPRGFSYALFFEQPFGADTLYPTGTSPSPVDAQNIYGGSAANLDSYRLTALLGYEFAPGFTVYGGPMVQAIQADATISFLSYNVESDTAFGFGYLVGTAYERPDIALRVALTYRSKIEHNFDTTETIGAATVESETSIETPQSITLDFQTGVAPKTLVFGQVHWMDWSNFEISPPNYPLLTSLGRPLVAYEEDWFTFTLGAGRQFTDRWSGRFAVTWDMPTNTELTSLGPVDGRWQLGLGARYETERLRVEGGVSYSFLGDAENVLLTDFNGGEAIGVGLRVGFKL